MLTVAKLAFATLIIVIAVGCGDQENNQTPAQQPTPPAVSRQSPPVVFPVHDAPPETDRGEEYLAGQLVLEEGCLRLQVPSNDEINPFRSYLLIWPDTFTYEEGTETVRAADIPVRAAAQVGDYIRLSRAEVTYEQVKDPDFVAGRFQHCAGPSFWVGDEVSVFDPKNEATELRLSNPDVLFLRQNTVMSVERVFLTAAGFGELALDGPCLKLDGEHTIIWPAGFTPHVEDGVVQVRNGAGRTIAKVGDEIAGGGGYHQGGRGECRGEVFRIYGIKVLPDVEIYFPKQDGTLATGRRFTRFAGELAVDGKCLVADNLIRVRDGSEVLGPALLIWPDTFELNTEDGAAEILDATGQVVARVGDRVEFNALDLTYTQAREHGGLDEITPVCSSPYWAVGEEFTPAATR